MEIGNVLTIVGMASTGFGAIFGSIFRYYNKHIKPAIKQFNDDVKFLKDSVSSLGEKLDENTKKTKEIGDKVDAVERETRTNGGSTIKDDLKLIKTQVLVNGKANDAMLYLYNDPLFKADTQGNYTFVNHKYLELAGVSGAEDMLGISWLKCVHEDDRHRVYTEWRDSVATESVFVCDYRIFNQTTEEVTNVSVRTTPIRDNKNQIMLYMGTIQTI